MFCLQCLFSQIVLVRVGNKQQNFFISGRVAENFPRFRKKDGVRQPCWRYLPSRKHFFTRDLFCKLFFGMFFFLEKSPAGKSNCFENFRKFWKTRLPWTNLFIFQIQARPYEFSGELFAKKKMRKFFTNFLNSDFLEIPVIDNSCILFLD